MAGMPQSGVIHPPGDGVWANVPACRPDAAAKRPIRTTRTDLGMVGTPSSLVNGPAHYRPRAEQEGTSSISSMFGCSMRRISGVRMSIRVSRVGGLCDQSLPAHFLCCGVEPVADQQLRLGTGHR